MICYGLVIIFKHTCNDDLFSAYACIGALFQYDFTSIYVYFLQKKKSQGIFATLMVPVFDLVID